MGQIQLHHVSWDMLSPPGVRPSPAVTPVPGIGAKCLRRSQCFIIEDHTAAEDTLAYATYDAADHTAGEETAGRTRLMPVTLLKITAASLCMTPTHTCAYEAPTPPIPAFITQGRPRPLEERHDRPLLLSGIYRHWRSKPPPFQPEAIGSASIVP